MFQQSGNTRFFLFTWYVVDVGVEVHIVPGREFFVECSLLWYCTEHLAHSTSGVTNIVAHHPCFAAGGNTQATDHVDGRCLTRSVGSQEPEDLSLLHC